MYAKLAELKQYLKEKAVELREFKCSIKDIQREHNGDCLGNQYDLLLKKKDYRHHHIAYCLIRGRMYEAIERPREENEPDQKIIQTLIQEYSAHEDVHTCA